MPDIFENKIMFFPAVYDECKIRKIVAKNVAQLNQQMTSNHSSNYVLCYNSETDENMILTHSDLSEGAIVTAFNVVALYHDNIWKKPRTRLMYTVNFPSQPEVLTFNIRAIHLYHCTLLNKHFDIQYDGQNASFYIKKETSIQFKPKGSISEIVVKKQLPHVSVGSIIESYVRRGGRKKHVRRSNTRKKRRNG